MARADGTQRLVSTLPEPAVCHDEIVQVHTEEWFGPERLVPHEILVGHQQRAKSEAFQRCVFKRGIEAIDSRRG